jgi:hypothetical protein
VQKYGLFSLQLGSIEGRDDEDDDDAYDIHVGGRRSSGQRSTGS